MTRFFNNVFVQAVGVGCIAYIIFRLIAFSLNGVLKILSSFASWYRYFGMKYADEAAIGQRPGTLHHQARRRHKQ